MALNFSNGLIGLSVLSGNTSVFGLMSSGIAFESAAVRRAKAQFTTPAAVAPWQEKPSRLPISSQVTAIRNMATIIDKPTLKESRLPEDVQTTFLAYKALDRLRILAEAGAAKGATDASRDLLQIAFSKGLEDLQGFLAEAPSKEVKLAFGEMARRAESVKLAATASTGTAGTGLVAARTDAIPGITGSETLEIKLTKYGVTDTVTVNLASTPQPPTLDSVTQALNAAIATVPMRRTDGTIATDANGDPIPKYNAKFLVEKSGDKWRMALSAPSFEQVALDQVGAPDALMVATGHTALDAPSATRILRFDDPAGAITQKTGGTIAAVDTDATELAKAASTTPDKVATVYGNTVARAITTDAQGNSYVVGTAAGDLGDNRLSGSEDLFLTKVDSEGKLLWQRTLGAATEAQGAAVTVAANGDVVVAGTVAGPFGGTTGTDSDMVVMKFNASGDETFATTVRSFGDQEATSVAVRADGSIFVGGKSSTGGGDAFVARLSSTGALQERRTIDSGGTDGVTALAFGAGGELLALTRESGIAKVRKLDSTALATDLGAISLGSADARALAVSATGEIAVGGATNAALTGTQVNAVGGSRDGFVARIDAGLTGASISYVATGALDEIDSITFMGGDIYAGGRTTGSLDGQARRGPTDGFVARIDSASGAIETVRQFGYATLRTEPVRVSAATGGAGIVGALGFHRGTLNPVSSATLVASTGLRAGDEFSFKVDGGTEKKITILATDTLVTLSDRIRKLAGTNVTVTNPISGDGKLLRIEAKAGHSIGLIAGPEGKDALARLGIEPGLLAASVIPDEKAPKVKPGGNFSLLLSDALKLTSSTDAGHALTRIKSAISMTQSAFRSLYWSDAKAAMVDGATSGSGGTPYQQKQLAMYQDALARLSGPNTYTGL
ncbi:hypothetical protein E2493_03930 [Sphingomonas parva]|uniref:Regulatory protein FlaEY n=1 Tax=Sphingomonas parva TaxID=2555898 RepID=A0A4Y8ZUB2_9SPHN|nr:hypothetical protein [Sphingomonas parva]TFI59628.1 hypothetical protein E2493_03930 [Sphingomonas parva]